MKKIEKIEPEENRIGDISEPIPASAKKVNELISAINEMRSSEEGCEHKSVHNPCTYGNDDCPQCTSTDTPEDEECDCSEYSCSADCTREHTHKTFSCPKCEPNLQREDKQEDEEEVNIGQDRTETLLDIIQTAHRGGSLHMMDVDRIVDDLRQELKNSA